jgi:hypothetical protein
MPPLISKQTQRQIKLGLFYKYTDMLSLSFFLISVYLCVKNDLMSTSYEVTV